MVESLQSLLNSSFTNHHTMDEVKLPLQRSLSDEDEDEVEVEDENENEKFQSRQSKRQKA